MDPGATIRPAVPADLAGLADLLVSAKLCQRDGLVPRLGGLASLPLLHLPGCARLAARAHRSEQGA